MFLLLYGRIILAIVISLVALNLFGQSTANANISANITEVSCATNLSDNSFAGFVGKSRINSIELNLEKVAENPTFTIIGSDHAYSITFPAYPIILKGKGGDETIKADPININRSLHVGESNISLSTTLQLIVCNPGYYYTVQPLPVIVHYN